MNIRQQIDRQLNSFLNSSNIEQKAKGEGKPMFINPSLEHGLAVLHIRNGNVEKLNNLVNQKDFTIEDLDRLLNFAKTNQYVKINQNALIDLLNNKIEAEIKEQQIFSLNM